jgi:hypothetical protein
MMLKSVNMHSQFLGTTVRLLWVLFDDGRNDKLDAHMEDSYESMNSYPANVENRVSF